MNERMRAWKSCGWKRLEAPGCPAESEQWYGPDTSQRDPTKPMYAAGLTPAERLLL